VSRRFRSVLASAILAAAVWSTGCATAAARVQGDEAKNYVSGPNRLAAIRKAQVWSPTDIRSKDLKNGPGGPGAFAPGTTITCDYVEKKLSGRSPKFTCVIPPDDELKVKYGSINGEVFGEVAASRLLWALGFGADRMYPVRVICRGCPATIKDTEFASVQRKIAGREIETPVESGWAWRELDLVDPAQGGAPESHRDALKLLAVFLQHSDSKSVQQRLVCVSDASSKDTPAATAPCTQSLMMVHDLGLTFGSANLFNRNPLASVNLARWSAAPVWKDAKHCVANLPKSWTGSLHNPVISEGGRKFLADLLVQLSDAQLRDLFEAARFDQRKSADPAAPGGINSTTTIDQWVEAFKKKRSEIVSHTCPE
jgi:hypothetical protein